MKLTTTLLLILFSGAVAVAQKKDFRERTLEETDSLIANALELLGKTDKEIIAGRPSSIPGGDKWDTEVIKMNKKSSPVASKTIIVGTGCGALMMMVSSTTNLVYFITYVPHKKAKLTGMEIWDHLDDTYPLDAKGNALIQAKDSSYIGLTLMDGAIVIVAFEEDKKTLRFEK